jgi:hypothetical protein
LLPVAALARLRLISFVVSYKLASSPLRTAPMVVWCKRPSQYSNSASVQLAQRDDGTQSEEFVRRDTDRREFNDLQLDYQAYLHDLARTRESASTTRDETTFHNK